MMSLGSAPCIDGLYWNVPVTNFIDIELLSVVGQRGRKIVPELEERLSTIIIIFVFFFC